GIVAPPLFPGEFGRLPEEYVSDGKWYAWCLDSTTILLTFLPAYSKWREVVMARRAMLEGKHHYGKGHDHDDLG
ncbi:unnamed protein product, partial [Chrysoparadoxa australica]